MTNHPLDGARKRIERANKHLNEIVSELDAYATREANKITIEHDEIRNQPNVILVVHDPIPDSIPLIVSDCIHNLRAALDYLVFELSREDSGDSDPSGTQFPISTEDKFIEHRKMRLKNKGPLRYLSDAHVDAIESYQPHKGVYWAAILRDISNPDKHREITLVRGRRVTNITDGIGEVFKGVGPDRTDVQMERKMTVWISFADELPVLETLQIIKGAISNAIDSFSPEFKV